jgi:hypothetical protein
MKARVSGLIPGEVQTRYVFTAKGLRVVIAVIITLVVYYYTRVNNYHAR